MLLHDSESCKRRHHQFVFSIEQFICFLFILIEANVYFKMILNKFILNKRRISDKKVFLCINYHEFLSKKALSYTICY